MTTIVVYSTGYCPYCSRAKQLLDSKGVHYDEIRVDDNPALRDEMIHKSGRRTVPQIFINGQHVGGCDDLYALEQQGRLDKLLKG
ncbi:glutaredoxin 3 [Legionella taurinensis]|uniref:Glutaredoxin n=1 Tax=Legionella taurinensis TaxID=70611 RepID=A0A3A5LB78_9GAMM|nr:MULTISPECIES: glutaredoxin 3 [Legionella]MDX1836456.1 glutaredoxin 3 [Legionella taurinensis]PUT43073.1 glutaredoxin 3 [Legionella taurinensis]PUT45110.1 glutaredoxin 3 [Legionella taurinensis]PUT45628.1 glutaredoxin 3 [Legionella taurinensis]PUT49397.1 glutaredoxin 3 [Legionella taurinensis]